ncbi:ParB/RepB/Spo0J family partition protein [Teredinibacter purpureus]|uniref:ParB/RepB/Spo0J family partition protein n=1 Tax=Teredinibacter purpureus TaxID=2731756 RepID=UPI0005F7F34E|nr:hypothetical protein [Teredinibacter purpureus]
MSLLIQASKTGAQPKQQSLSHEMIKLAPYLPRVDIDSLAFDELVDSTSALMAPVGEILVRPYTDHYEVLFGREYFEAYRVALPGSQVPVNACHYSDEEALYHSLRLHSSHHHLDPIAIAECYKKAIEHFQWSRSNLAKAVGIQRSTVTNRLELLKLSSDVKEAIRSSKLSIEHGKTLSRLTASEQNRFCKLAIQHSWDTRTLYKKVNPDWNPKGSVGKNSAGVVEPVPKDSYLSGLESQLSDVLGAPIELNVDKRKGYKGKVDIKFFSLGELVGFVERIERNSKDELRWNGLVSLNISDMDHLNDVLGDMNPEDDF